MKESNSQTWRGVWTLFAGVMLITLCAWFETGCSKSEAPSKEGPYPDAVYKVSQISPNVLTIDSISFGELNRGEEYNASDIIPLADSRFLICDNKTNDALFELNLTFDGRKKGPLIRRPLQGLAPGGVDDIEDMAMVDDHGRRYIFVTSSMHVRKGSNGSLVIPPNGLLRVKINQDESLSAENMNGFRDWLIDAYPQLASSAKLRPKEGGLNIEGLAWDKNRNALLFGLRTPVPNGKPIILPVRVKDIAGPWATNNLEAMPPISLSVSETGEEQGIRSIDNEQGRDSFLVITGKSIHHGEAPFSLYEWSGNAEGAMRRFNIRFASDMKPEGITRGLVGGKTTFVVVDDGGGYQVIWSDKGLSFAKTLEVYPELIDYVARRRDPELLDAPLARPKAPDLRQNFYFARFLPWYGAT